MNKGKSMVVGTLVVLAMGNFTAAAAADFYEVAPQRDVNLCVAEIQQNLDYTGAGHVRHELDSKKRRGVGYELTIDTAVFDHREGQLIREYQAVCIVTGGRKPLSFSMHDKRDGS